MGLRGKTTVVSDGGDCVLSQETESVCSRERLEIICVECNVF